MSLGLSEGGEQNAALGRAVIGGLFGSTSATLLFVPVVYSVLAALAAPWWSIPISIRRRAAARGRPDPCGGAAGACCPAVWVVRRPMPHLRAILSLLAVPRRPTDLRGLVAIGVALVALGVVGTLPHLAPQRGLAETQATASAARRVLIGKATSGPTRVGHHLARHGTPFRGTMLYAKTTGFLRGYSADIGDQVEPGRCCAEIQAPETDEELRLARAKVREAEPTWRSPTRTPAATTSSPTRASSRSRMRRSAAPAPTRPRRPSAPPAPRSAASGP